MAKYRKKPVEIEAIQWNGMNIDEVKQFAGDNVTFVYYDEAWKLSKAPVIAEPQIKTLEGIMTAQRNDFIIKGVNGEFYPCKPDIFVKTYEPVEVR